MTLQQLRYVTSIAETGTLSEAARRFYIAQPSLTASLRELEEELGLTIFRRTNRGAVLTPEGEEFLGYARQVLGPDGLNGRKVPGRGAGQASILRVHPALLLCSGSLCGATAGVRRPGVRLPHPRDPDLRADRGCGPIAQRGRRALLK